MNIHPYTFGNKDCCGSPKYPTVWSDRIVSYNRKDPKLLQLRVVIGYSSFISHDNTCIFYTLDFILIIHLGLRRRKQNL